MSSEEQYFEFDCGCRFKQLSSTVKESDNLPELEVDFYNLPNCHKVWGLFEEGLTGGVFQLESNLGQTWSKKACPHNIDELGDLVSIIRPGTIENVYDGKNASTHYVDRKRGREESHPEYPALGEILADTYHVMIYQEQIIQIAKSLAGMSGKDATVLMKAVGKKKFELMEKMREIFVKGCQETSGLSEEEATSLFDGISASSRYLFNKCLSPDTTVTRADGGITSLDNLEINDNINTPEGVARVTNKIEQGKQDLFEVTLSSGKTIKCTMQHKFLASDKKIHTLEEIIKQKIGIMCE